MYCTRCGKQNENTKFCVHCGAALSAGEAENSAPAADAAPAEAPVPAAAYPAAAAEKSVSRGALIGIAAGVAAALVIGIVLMIVLMSGKKGSPLENTMNAVFPEAVMTSGSVEKGASLTIGAKLGSDLTGSSGLSGASAEITAAASDGGKAQLTGKVRINGIKYDAGLICDGERLAISSKALLGKNSYYLDLKNLTEQLDNSVFSPNSRTPFSLDRSAYSGIKSVLESFNGKSDSIMDIAAISEAFGRIADKTLEAIKCEKSTEPITIDGETFDAEKVTYQLDKSIITAFMKELKAEWKENSELRKAIGSCLSSVQGISSVMSAIDSLMDSDPDDIIDSAFGGVSAGGSIEAYTKGDYLVKLDAELSLVPPQESDAVKLSFNADFSGDPVKTPRLSAELQVKSGDKTLAFADAEYSRVKEGGSTVSKLRGSLFSDGSAVSVDVKSELQSGGRYKTDFSLGNYSGYDVPSESDFEQMAKAALTGKYTVGSDSIYLSLDGFSASVREKRAGSTAREQADEWRDCDYITDSEFYIEFKLGSQSISIPDGAKNILELDENELSEIFGGRLSDFSRYFGNIPNFSGFARNYIG